LQGGQLVWAFDLDGIAQMYDSYEGSSLWPFLARPQDGISVSFVRAERSAFRWCAAESPEPAAISGDKGLLCSWK
jgi:hypothetical protein